MSHQSELIQDDILAYLKSQEQKNILRFITCGSVDDGKSTLIGRLLYEAKLIYEDQLTALEQDSKKVGTQGANIDFALLVDGLAAEREQGITIDVAYRYFSTDKRKFIVADTPGHEQYTRNMATGASTAQCAILMIDARRGVLTQTKRHSKIVHMLGVDQIVLAINKMDLVNYDQARYEEILNDYTVLADQIGIKNITAIPVSALAGDNITEPSEKMPWYTGTTLMNFLETVKINPENQDRLFSMPIQWVNRPHLDFRGFSGQITAGAVSVGDEVTILPSQVTTQIKSIVTFDGDLKTAIKGESVTLTFADEVDASRGDVIVSNNTQVQVAHSFETQVLWMSEQPFVPGKTYWIKTRAKLLSATLKEPKYKIDANTLEHKPAHNLDLNEIGISDLIIDQDIAFEPYEKNRNLGSFIIIDRMNNNTVGMGLIQKALDQRSWVDRYVQQRNKYWERSDVSNEERQQKYGHKPVLIILSGESTQNYAPYAKQLEKELFNNDIAVYRYGFKYMGSALSDDASLNQDEMRQEMVRNLVEKAHAFCDAGTVFITAIHALKETELTAIKTIMDPFDVVECTVGASSRSEAIQLTEHEPIANNVIDQIINNLK
ncbi:sulfate adenylyltransferase subunit CysN [Candidatus Marinamargulisbacteria bacterium SCGC AG-414-C22]|nr:sulfate adenylyltransferase subunit CysN [Candidatus Marinamargulisbacteria bacterium SCGC AG-414-C22]